jgi:hypothetical protein
MDLGPQAQQPQPAAAGRATSNAAFAVALLALFVALGGTAWAVADLPRNSVGSEQVRDRSLQRRDFKPGVLRRGPAGPAGPQGPVGASGPVGPPGLSGYASVTSTGPTTIAPGAYGFATAECPSGTVQLAGGQAVQGEDSLRSLVQVESFPYGTAAGGRGWQVTMRNVGTVPGVMRAYVVCARVA